MDIEQHKHSSIDAPSSVAISVNELGSYGWYEDDASILDDSAIAGECCQDQKNDSEFAVAQFQRFLAEFEAFICANRGTSKEYWSVDVEMGQR